MRKSQYIDLAITESLNGGELLKTANDFAVVFGKENMPYLKMFGGNTDKSQWWGNKVALANQPILQYNSLTEWTLNNTPLTSAGRLAIETAVKTDLSFLNPSLVQVSIISDNKVGVLIRGDFGESTFNFIKRNDGDGDFFILDFNNDFY